MLDFIRGFVAFVAIAASMGFWIWLLIPIEGGPFRHPMTMLGMATPVFLFIAYVSIAINVSK
jgi:hypothetical protein